jgi:hypothetical protein
MFDLSDNQEAAVSNILAVIAILGLVAWGLIDSGFTFSPDEYIRAHEEATRP